jgi:streptogramin lyase
MAFSFRIPAFAACTLLLAACHGGGGFTPTALPQSDAAIEPAGKTPTVAMKYSIKIPPLKTTATQAERHEQFVSASTQSIVFAIYKPGSTHNAKNLISNIPVALNAGAKGCNKAKARTCSGTLNLPPPSVDIVATTYDLKPAGKKIPKKAKKLAIATIVKQVVKANQKIGFTLGGIPASFSMTIAGATVVNGVQTATMFGMFTGNTNIAVAAFDADGNLIVTDGYVDAAGASTGIAMSEKASHPTCGKAVLQADPTKPGRASIVVSAPAPDGVFFNYGSNGIAKAFTTAGYCSFAVTARLGTGPVQQGAFVLSGPLLSEYSIGSSLAQPDGITLGPDGNIWFVDLEGNVGTINVTTRAISEYPLANPAGIVSSNGSLWVSTYNSIVQVQTNGSMSSFPTTATGNPAEQLAVDSSGNFWFTETQAQKVAKVTPSGATTEFSVSGSPYPVGIAGGSDGNMWFTGCVGNKIGRITPAAPNTQTLFSVPNSSTGPPAPFMMVGGPDGNLWFTSCGAGTIARVPIPSGSTVTPTFFQAPSTDTLGRGQMYGLAAGPNGDMLATDIADNTIDRIPLTATDVSQMTVVKVSQTPYWVTSDSNGAIWFTEHVVGNGIPPNGMIGRIQP